MLVLAGFALGGYFASATEDLRQAAPAVVIDYHCHREDYPHFWQALRELKVKNGHIVIDADLALADVLNYPGQRRLKRPREVSPQAHEYFMDTCLLPLLREHVRPSIDEALHLVVLQSDQRREQKKLLPTREFNEISAFEAGRK